MGICSFTTIAIATSLDEEQRREKKGMDFVAKVIKDLSEAETADKLEEIRLRVVKANSEGRLSQDFKTQFQSLYRMACDALKWRSLNPW